MVENTTYLEDGERKKRKRKKTPGIEECFFFFIRKILNKSSHVKPNLNSCYGGEWGAGKVKSHD